MALVEEDVLQADIDVYGSMKVTHCGFKWILKERL